MRLVTKVVIGIASLGAVPAAAAVVLSGDAWTKLERVAGRNDTTANMSVRDNDQVRILPVAAPDQDAGTLLGELSAPSRAPTNPPPVGPQQAFDFPAPFGPPPPDWAGPPPMMAPPSDRLAPMAPLPPPPVHPPFTRAVCEEEIDRGAALTAYMKSKLKLQANQREAWQRFEQAAEPASAKLRAACERLPIEANTSSLSDWTDRLDEQLSARLELLRAIREPLRALFDTLSPQQQSMLRPSLPRMTGLQAAVD